MKHALASVAFMAIGLVGCSARYGALDPAGKQARELDRIFWIFFWPTAIVFVAVVVVALMAVAKGLRSARSAREVPAAEPGGDSEKRVEHAVVVSSVASAVILVVLLVASIASGHRLSELGASTPLRIQVTAHQWWWEVQYPGAFPGATATTANEIHVPAGTPVELELRSADVVHSFWVPSLNGKRDLIPGRVNKLALYAERLGAFQGRCAEFCGLQHAQMDLVVIVDTPRAFAVWLEGQRSPARSPKSELETQGLSVFVHGTCASCHTISGTTAAATLGPDLTHFAGRATLGAGAGLRNQTTLTRWIANAQDLKPGARMPPFSLEPAELSALTAYLESLL